MAKSYYAILGITSDASNSEIRSAYRRLAKAYHPDHYPGGSQVFRDIQEAYAVLGDQHRRVQYEQNLRRAKPVQRARTQPQTRPEPLIPEQQPRPADLGEISPIRSFRTFTPSFDAIFDWLCNNHSDLNWPKSGRVEQLTLEVPVTKDQAARGGVARIMVPARFACRTCRGAGAIGPYACHRCAGEGAITGEIPISVSFPPGIGADHAVVIPLDRFGIRNLQLTVLFRPSSGERF